MAVATCSRNEESYLVNKTSLQLLFFILEE